MNVLDLIFLREGLRKMAAKTITLPLIVIRLIIAVKMTIPILKSKSYCHQILDFGFEAYLTELSMCISLLK